MNHFLLIIIPSQEKDEQQMNKDLLLSEIFLQILYKVTNYKLYKDIQEQRSSELRKRNEKEASA